MVTRPIHEETLLNYFDPNKKESKLVAKKKTEVAVTQAVPKHAGFLVCMYFAKFCQHYSKKIYIQWYFKLTTDNYAYIFEREYRLVFSNLGTENQNVNSVIVIVLASCVISYKKTLDWNLMFW